ncbi:alkanesulfonate transporter permease subunit [Candidatus Pacearchaeota archaeon]|nr:alkanesulfonate transporter permease subunit [Candidatus Pacearchaeota archaeon]
MKRIKDILISFILPTIILLIWQLSITFGFIPQSLIASPLQVIENFFRLLFNGELINHSFVSIQRLIVGFTLGTVLGILLGVIVGTSKLAEKIVSPSMKVFAPIPPIAWIPLIIILFGIGEESKVALIALASFVVAYINTFNGIRSTDKKLIELSKVYNKDKKQLLYKILLPSALPNIFIGMRIALGLSWILLIASELIASSSGLGWLIWNSRNFSRPDDMIVGMISIAILGFVSDKLLVMFEKKMLEWRNTFEGE